jgi:phage tail-like protein
MTAVTVLPAQPRPPHDPLWIALGRPRRWPAGLRRENIEGEGAAGDLVLAVAPADRRRFDESSGSMGGLVTPVTLAADRDGAMVLLDVAIGALLRLDPCCCRFEPVACGTTGQRAFVAPRAVLFVGSRLVVADAGPPGRVLVFDRVSLVLRAVWTPPPGTIASPWMPTRLVVNNHELWVADSANGVIHRFAFWGGHLGIVPAPGSIAGFGCDRDHHLWIALEGVDRAVRIDSAGNIIETATSVEVLALRFEPSPVETNHKGAFTVQIGPCAGKSFAPDGTPLPSAVTVLPHRAETGVYVSDALDSGIADCQWHRIVLQADLPPLTLLSIEVTTSDEHLPDSFIQAPEMPWTPLPPIPNGSGDALIMAPRGRYLWFRLTLHGSGTATPRVERIDFEFPRLGLARHLPAPFRQDPISADFTHRLVAIADTGFRAVESRIDNRAELVDPWSASAEPKRDQLGFLGRWLGLVLEQRWPVARRRRMLAAAGRLMRCRGTVDGLRGVLAVFLGWTFDPHPTHACCAPRCAPPGLPPPAPPLVLEHWKLRRWLFLGLGRLGDDAELWGARLLYKSQLDVTARVGATRIDTVRDPQRDPFHTAAHRISLFLPAKWGRDRADRAALNRLIKEFAPAHVAANVIYVEPRMRIGIQSSLSFDTVIGCYPSGVPLGTARLGRGTILPATDAPDAMGRIGRTSFLGAPVGGRTSAEREGTP